MASDATIFEMVAIQQRRKHESRRISIVWNRYQTTTGEDMEDFMSAAV
jgi:hypothetical protein